MPFALPRRRLFWSVTLALVALLAPAVRNHVRAATLLLGFSETPPALVKRLQSPVVREELSIPLARGAMRARLYRPERTPLLRPRALVLVHGVHRDGYEEARLMRLARAFASVGVVVLTPELPALAGYRIADPDNLERLRASVDALARRNDVASGGVGLMGISFAGGLSLRVAAEPGTGARLAFVASLGGHDDLERVARFLVTDEAVGPDGAHPWKAHEYGTAVLAANLEEKLVSESERAPFDRVLRAWLAGEESDAGVAAKALSSSRPLYDELRRHDRTHLRRVLLEVLPTVSSELAAASPTRHVQEIRAPLFLLHGAADEVVPPDETRWIVREAGRDQDVTSLVSPRIGHAELGKPDWREDLKLVHFMAALLSR